MNNDCQGDFYSINGVSFYRCFMDGAVVENLQGSICSLCQRPLNAVHRGEAPTRTAIEVRLGNSWIPHTAVLVSK